MGTAFDKIYTENLWSNGSGPGSSPDFTIEYRGFLERFFRLNRIRSIVDIGCGDWQFSRFMDFAGARYVGLDVVESVIERNRNLHARERVDFALMPPSLADVPSGDLLIIKDVLQHLPDADIHAFVRELFPRYRFALITNSFEKLHTPRNVDVQPGEFRCLDLTAAPYRVRGAYVFEYWSAAWERIRTLLVQPSAG